MWQHWVWASQDGLARRYRHLSGSNGWTGLGARIMPSVGGVAGAAWRWVPRCGPMTCRPYGCLAFVLLTPALTGTAHPSLRCGLPPSPCQYGPSTPGAACRPLGLQLPPCGFPRTLYPYWCSCVDSCEVDDHARRCYVTLPAPPPPSFGSYCTALRRTLRLPLTRETHSAFCLDTAPPESCRASVLLNPRSPLHTLPVRAWQPHAAPPHLHSCLFASALSLGPGGPHPPRLRTVTRWWR